ncbi:MAG: histone deacetylase family protein [Proteobacteria bacterium]|nr:histone deacetylase family protein [Pseudomonadota bacterium]
MDIIYTEQHRLRNSKTELFGGELVPPFESPQRVETIRQQCLARNIGEIRPPNTYSPELPHHVHSAPYVQFIADCWRDWQAGGNAGEAIATCWPSRALPRQIVPKEIDGRIGYYAMAGETSISAGTYEAALAAAATAATAADLLHSGQHSAFALCRPPGHHAATDMFGGYCFFNNVAIAAQQLLNHGAARVAILDTDFHHGNGTQEIFYQRDDVLFISLHGDPIYAFPYFLGFADEHGTGAGEGYNINYPLAPETNFAAWNHALQESLTHINNYAPDYLLVSLGVDTYCKDPISFFKLDSDDFYTYGKSIAGLGLPTAFVMEGGYAVEEIGINAANVLEGFSAGQ